MQNKYLLEVELNLNRKIIILFFIVLACDLLGLKAQSRQQLENEKVKLEKDIASMNEILRQTKKNKKMSATELQIIRKKVEQRQQLVNNITTQVNILNSQIQSTKQNIGESYRNLEIMKQNYAKMLRYAQKNRTAIDKLLFIFSAKDYHEAYQRYVFFRKFGQIQRQQMAIIENKTIELNNISNDLSKQKKTQSVLLFQEKANTASLNKERLHQEKVVKDIKSKESQIAKQLKQAQAKRKKLQQQINAAINAEVKKQRQIAAKAKINKSSSLNKSSKVTKNSSNPTNAQYTMSATAAEVKTSQGFEGNKGRLPWPVDKGVIVSCFGVHEHPDIKGVQIENLGLDIRTTKGSSVKSVYEGNVCKVWTGPNGNKIVIIRHGDYMTVYTNLEIVTVSDGSNVSMGQKIGTVATNSNGQSEINFQVRKASKAQNPALWLRR